MFCPNCGNEMSESAAFCTNCGWSKSGGRVAEAKKFKIPIIPIVIIVLLIAAVLIIKNVFFVGDSNNSVRLMSSNNITNNSFNSVKLVSSFSEDTTIDQMETVKFGSYPQSDESGNKKEPIEWIVLDRQGGKTLLLSKYILDCKSFNNVHEDVTWETCSLRNWLNNDFYNQAFKGREQKKIQITNVINSDNTKYGTKGGSNTNDKIFCISINEAEKYFYQFNMQSENKKLATRGTNYAKNVKNGSDGLYVNDDFDKWYNGNSDFWLRSPGYGQNIGAIVNASGYLYVTGNSVDVQNIGVRPALWVSD